MRFTATIVERPSPKRPGLWLGVVIPAKVAKALHATRDDGTIRKRIPVRGTVAGAEYRSSVTALADGDYEFIVSLDVRGRAGVALGDTVEIEMVEDVDARELPPPPDVAEALEATPGLRDLWDAEPWSHKRELVLYLDDAKKLETRAKRVGQIVAMLAKKSEPPEKKPEARARP